MLSETMQEWLKTRRHLYIELGYAPRSPYLPPKVVNWLKAEIGPPAPPWQQSSFPIWKIRKIKSFDLTQVRKFLADYDLTAYYGNGYHSGSVCIITPKVPQTVVEKLNNELGVIGKENQVDPCFEWELNLDDVEEAEALLQKVRNLIKQYPVIPHLTCDSVSQPIEEWSFGPEVYEEFYQVFNIAVASSNDKFDLLRYYELNGANYDFYTEDIIKELMLLDKQYGIDYFVSVDEVQLKRIPKGQDLRELQEWFGCFCPDLAYEPNAIEALARGRVQYWWD